MYLFQVNDPRQSASLVAKIFNFVVDILEKAASALGLTYNEINIILYYFIIPLSWTLLLDRFLGKPITTLILIGAWAVLLVCKGREFRNWCDWEQKCLQICSEGVNMTVEGVDKEFCDELFGIN